MQPYPIYHQHPQSMRQHYPMWQSQYLQQQKEQMPLAPPPMNPYMDHPYSIVGGAGRMDLQPYLQPYSYGLYQSRQSQKANGKNQLRKGGQMDDAWEHEDDDDDADLRNGGDDSDSSSSSDDDDDDRYGGFENEEESDGPLRAGGATASSSSSDVNEASARIGGGKNKKVSLTAAMKFVQLQRPRYAKKGVKLVTLGNYPSRKNFKRRTGSKWDVFNGLAHHTKSGQERQDFLLIKKPLKVSAAAAKRGLLTVSTQKLVSIRKWMNGVKRYAENKKDLLPYQYKKQPMKMYASKTETIAEKRKRLASMPAILKALTKVPSAYLVPGHGPFTTKMKAPSAAAKKKSKAKPKAKAKAKPKARVTTTRWPYAPPPKAKAKAKPKKGAKKTK